MYIALLRAVNVGGTGKLSMVDLTRLCVQAGFCNVKTYIDRNACRAACKSLSRGGTCAQLRVFLAGKPPRDALRNVQHQKDEDIRVGKREIYVYYPSGMGQSKLIIPAGSSGTARNMNTVAKLVQMTA
jgi:uncharacterized protein (DUF1697 family)